VHRLGERQRVARSLELFDRELELAERYAPHPRRKLLATDQAEVPLAFTTHARHAPLELGARERDADAERHRRCDGPRQRRDN
jgi:hypothetical protein